VLELTIAATLDDNPQANGSPGPVALRFYQLATTGAFERADAVALSEHEAFTLGSDLQQVEELIIAPGQTRTLKRNLKAGAQFLGVAVYYRDIDQAKWRAIGPLNASGPTRLTLAIHHLSANLGQSQ
jgi:type VI secretion system protein VasD